MYGRWLGNGSAAVSAPAAGWRNGAAWESDDLPAALDLYRAVSPTARKVLDFWASRGGEWASGSETADAVGVNGPTGLAGTLSSVGKAAGKVGRQLPFQHEDGEVGTSGNYRMSKLLCGLFAAASREFDR
jgi:hypothetical protein